MHNEHAKKRLRVVWILPMPLVATEHLHPPMVVRSGASAVITLTAEECRRMPYVAWGGIMKTGMDIEKLGEFEIALAQTLGSLWRLKKEAFNEPLLIG